MVAAEVTQLLVLLVNFAAGACVDEEGDQDDDPWRSVSIRWGSCEGRKGAILPNRAVESSNAEDIPVRRHPAPQSCVTVHTSLLRRRDKDEGERNNERYSVAAEQIRNLHASQPLGIELEIEGEVHVHGHSQRPEGIGRHEPLQRR